MLAVLARHAVVVAVTVGACVGLGADPRVLAWTYIFLLAIRLATVRLLLHARASGRPTFVAKRLESLSRPPAAGATPLIWRHEQTWEPAGFAAYFIMTAVYAGFASLLLYAGTGDEGHVGGPTLLRELGIAAALAALYGIEELFSGSVILDLAAEPAENYAHNVGGNMVVLHLSILLCGVLRIFVHDAGPDLGGWLLFGPVVALKHVGDLAADMGRARVK